MEGRAVGGANRTVARAVAAHASRDRHGAGSDRQEVSQASPRAGGAPRINPRESGPRASAIRGAFASLEQPLPWPRPLDTNTKLCELQSTQPGKPRWLTPPSNAFCSTCFYAMDLRSS